MHASASQTRSIQLLVMAICIIGLLAILLPTGSPEDTSRPLLLDVDPEDIVALGDIDSSTQRHLQLNALGWMQTHPWRAPADDQRIRSHVSALAGLEALRTVDVIDLEFHRHITLEELDGTSHELRIGRRAPGSSGHYVRVGQTTWVSATEIPGALTDDIALDKRVLAFKRHQAKYITFGSTELQHTRAGWRLRSGIRWQMADQSQVEKLIDALLDLRFESFSPASPATPLTSIRVKNAHGDEIATRDVGRTGGWVGKVHGTRWASITPGLEPWQRPTLGRNTVFDFESELVEQYTMQVEGHDQVIGQKDDAVTDELLSITGKADPSVSMPEATATLTVHLAGQNQAHTVHFWRSEGEIFASQGHEFIPQRLDLPSADYVRTTIGVSSL